ncbi:ARM repeat-containing protein [Wallemia mellicola]|uniref:DNA polymerase delta catalytic subunit n=1 Tax=Wallemia mellicola TaxID=1708541 RepID=A0A4T0NXQ1_9BASI|nr:ARM repeat-containing protein [Wallemia mellicola]
MAERQELTSYTAPKEILEEFNQQIEEEDHNPFAWVSLNPTSELLTVTSDTIKKKQIAERQSDYHNRRFNRGEGDLSNDNFSGEGVEGSSYADRMRQNELDKEEARVRKIIEERREQQEAENDGKQVQPLDGDKTPPREAFKVENDATPPKEAIRERKRRWDVAPEQVDQVKQEEPPKKRRSRWDEAPAEATPSETKPRRSRWDQTPSTNPVHDKTVADVAAMLPPALMGLPAVPLGLDPFSAQNSSARNRYITDEELDILLPSEGYAIVPIPEGYQPLRSSAHKMMSAIPMDTGFNIAEKGVSAETLGISTGDLPTEIEGIGSLAYLKPEDAQYFGKVLQGEDVEPGLSMEELKDRKIMRLLLKIKNGTPQIRKSALRQITEKARELGAGPLFDRILPLLMERTLEDQERHLLVKVIDRVLYKLDDLVRPYVHKILVVIEPLLIDEDYFARVEGREIISNLAKAAGLAHMISTMRPDIDHMDEYVRNTTARAFSVVASALGIPALLPFLKAVCRSKKSWQARHTGIRIVQQIAIMMGCAILPHLRHLVSAIAHSLEDEQQKVRTMGALAIAALAEAATPYGIESFDAVLKPLWLGIRKHRGKALAAFLKAIGFIIPLMDSEYASYYTKEVMVILIREFQSSDEEMKKIVLKVVKQCAGTDGVEPGYLKEEVLPDFFRNFWVRRMALDRRNYRQVVETTVELANKCGVMEIVGRIVNNLKDESEPMRKMVMETITKVVENLGAADIDERLEIQLIDGMIYSFQEQTLEDAVMLDGFGTIVNALGSRIQPYLLQIVSTILWRLNNKGAKVRMQAADLTARLAVVIKTCNEEQYLHKLGVVLFEGLGEEYPDTLGSFIAAEAAIANVVGMNEMQPPVRDLLPRMTPILRNRHEKVQEATINLIGRIADRGSEYVPAREWMRICFELLDLLKANKKAIRRAAVNSFGYIAKAIGPQDVLSVLLTNLRVQERQSRVCSTVAIAIVAETCGPFTCIPAILNEYRTPDLNVRNGCLKALAWVCEYIGELAKDYVYALVGCIEDSITDRDHVHRQTSAAIIKHLTLGVAGFGKEDALLHMLNLVWPNIYEVSPHVIGAVMEAIESMRVCSTLHDVMSTKENIRIDDMSNPINKKRKITDDTKSIKQASQDDKKQSTFADILESLQDEAEKNSTESSQVWGRPSVPKFESMVEPIIFQQIDLEEASIPGAEPFIRMHGVTQDGYSVMANVTGFLPYLYIAAPRGFTKEECEGFSGYLNATFGNNGKRIVADMEMHTKRSLWGYKGDEKSPFIKITFVDQRSMTRVRDKCTLLDFSTTNKPYDASKESNISYDLRFMIDKKVVGMSWIECPGGAYNLKASTSKVSKAQLEFDIHHKDIIAHPAEGEWQKMAPLRILSFDIECAGRQGIFPEAQIDPVIQIANMVTRQGESKPFIRNVFTLKSCAHIAGSQVLSFEDESKMLNAWRDFVEEADPDVVIGYNTSNFDIPYLMDRAKALKATKFCYLGRMKNVKSEVGTSHFSSKAYGTRDSKTTNMEGRLQLDLLQLIQREHKLRSYSLNSVCAEFLGEQKEDVHHSIITELQNGTPESRRRLAVYCLKDAYLPQRLLDRLMSLVNQTEMARVTGVPFNYLLAKGQSIKVMSQICRQAQVHGYLVPALRVEGSDEQYEGATVIEPRRGYYDVPITTLDFSSLYPSIMMAHNLCYTTLLDPQTVERLKLKEGEDYIKTPNNDMFVTPVKRKGLLPVVLQDLISARKRARADIKSEKDPFRRAVLDGRQLALKVSANSVYGFTGATIGKLPCLPISSSTTAYGRRMIERTKEEVESHYKVSNNYSHDAEVVYGDTDSVMIKFGCRDLETAMKLGAEAAGVISSKFPNPIKLEFEKVYYPYLLINKKRYAGLYWTGLEKYDKMDTKGIETVRRDNCRLVGTVITTCLHKMLIDRDVKAAEDYTKHVISELLQNKIDMSQLVITKALTKTEYDAKQAHVCLAERMRKRDAGSAPALGDRVAYVIVKGSKGAAAYERSEDPLFVLENNVPIDTKYYLENQLSKPLLRIFEPILGEKSQSLLTGDHTRTITVATPSIGGLMKFAVKTVTCLGCKAPIRGSDAAVCKNCKGKAGELYQKQVASVSALQVQFARLWTQCQRCQGSLHQDVICTNKDCNIFYMRQRSKFEVASAVNTLERFNDDNSW